MRLRLVIGITLSVALLAGGLVIAGFVAADDRAHARDREQLALDEAAETIQNEVDRATEATAGFAVLYEHPDSTDGADFQSLASGATSATPLTWIVWAPERSGAARGAGARPPDLEAASPSATPPPPSSGAEAYPAEAVSPGAQDEALRGVDFAGGAVTESTVREAVESGEPRLTPPLTSPNGDRQVLLARPVYERGAPTGTVAERRAAARGVIVAALDLPRIQSAAGDVAVAEGQAQVIGPATTDESVQRPVSVGGRDWLVAVPVASADGSVPVLIALLGAALAAGVLGITILDARRDKYATERVREALAAQEKVEEDLREERNQAKALGDFAESLVEAAARDEGDLLEVATERISEAFGAEEAGVVQFADGELVRLSGPATPPETAVRACRRAEAESAASRVEQDERVIVAAPIPVQGRAWGATWVMGRASDLPDRAGDWLRGFSDLIGLGIADGQARRELVRQATTDPQTGLANLRTFREHLLHRIADSRRHGRDLSLVLIDIDHFKRVNYSYGHPAGDRVLTELARRLRVVARASDVLARVGGEEFAWLMPESGRLEAWSAAERARAAVAAEPFGEVGPVTISAGVADLALARDAEELYRNADQSLYLAKRYGRDIVFLYQANEVAAIAAEDPSTVARRRAELAHLQVLAHEVAERGQLGRDHPARVARIAVALAERLGWREDRVALLEQAAVLHDIGMAAVPATVELDSAGPLATPAHTMVAAHPREGARMVGTILPEGAAEWVRGHHERWDGGGYPDGLAGERISEGARILAVSEAWDALTTDRPYRPALDVEEALAEMRRGSGTEFWPAAVEALAELVASVDPAIELSSSSS